MVKIRLHKYCNVSNRLTANSSVAEPEQIFVVGRSREPPPNKCYSKFREIEKPISIPVFFQFLIFAIQAQPSLMVQDIFRYVDPQYGRPHGSNSRRQKSPKICQKSVLKTLTKNSNF